MQKVKCNFDEYIERLINKGYKLIGSGSYARVYAKDKERTALRIFKWDEPYMNFIKRIRRLKNPYFPKIKSVRHYECSKEFDNWTIVKLERLEPLQNVKYKDKSKILKSYSDYIFSRSGYSIKHTSSEDLDFNLLVREFEEEELNDKDLVKALKVLSKLEDEGNALDLHGWNVMLRKEKKDYRLVFTDPFWEGD